MNPESGKGCQMDSNNVPTDDTIKRFIELEQRIVELEAHNEHLKRAVADAIEWNWVDAIQDAEDSGRGRLKIPEMQEIYDIRLANPPQSINKFKAQGIEEWILEIPGQNRKVTIAEIRASGLKKVKELRSTR